MSIGDDYARFIIDCADDKISQASPQGKGSGQGHYLDGSWVEYNQEFEETDVCAHVLCIGVFLIILLVRLQPLQPYELYSFQNTNRRFLPY